MVSSQVVNRVTDVTSLAEVWIEIEIGESLMRTKIVTSLAEVWIEIPALDPPQILQSVTSLAEVWIEISDPEVTQTSAMRHFPRGSVD